MAISFNARISTKTFSTSGNFIDETLRKNIEIFLNSSSVTDETIRKNMEIFLKDSTLIDETIKKNIEIYIVSSLQDEIIRKNIETFIGSFSSFSSESRIITKVLESKSKVESESRPIVFIQDPKTQYTAETKISSKAITYEPVENFDIMFDDIFTQKVGDESNLRNQIDAYCTILWKGTFDKRTRFGVAYSAQDTDGNSFLINKPIDLSLAKVLTLTPELKWSASSDPEVFLLRQTIKYDLEISKTFTMKKPIYSLKDISGTSIVVPSGILEYGKKYYWRIRSKDVDTETGKVIDYSEWTNIFSFEVVESIQSSIPQSTELYWDHPFLLPEGKNYYFWDTRNLSAKDINGNDIQYKPVIYQYQFHPTDNSVADFVAVKQGVTFYINHIAANPPIFISGNYDSQTHSVVLRVLISDSLARRYQLSNFQYLDRTNQEQTWKTIPDAQILGEKRDLKSDVFDASSRGLCVWDASGDPDQFINQDLVYNIRVLREPLHRNNNFYYLVEYVTELYNIIQSDMIDFGEFWGLNYNQDNFPNLLDVDRSKTHDYSDIRFFNHGWNRIQVEVVYPDLNLIKLFDTEGIDLAGDIEISDNSASLQYSIFSEIETIEKKSSTLFNKTFNITNIVKKIYEDSIYNLPFHIFVEINYGNYNENNWGESNASLEYSDAIIDSNLYERNKESDSYKSLTLNSIRDFGSFVYSDSDILGAKNNIKFNGINLKSTTDINIIMPNWIPDTIQIRVRLAFIESGEFSFGLKRPITSSISSSFDYLTSNPSAELSITLNSPYGSNSFDVLNFKYRIRGMPSKFSSGSPGSWSNYLESTKIFDSKRFGSAPADKDTYLSTKDIYLSSIYEDIEDTDAIVIKISILDQDDNILDEFLSVDNNEEDAIFQNNNNDNFWRNFDLLNDWDYKSKLRVKLKKNYHAIYNKTSIFYKIEAIANNVYYLITFDELYKKPLQLIIPDNTIVKSNIIKEFEQTNEFQKPIFIWSQTRSRIDGNLFIDLKHSYYIESIEIDFTSYPNEKFILSYFNPDINKEINILISNMGISSKVIINNTRILASRINIYMKSTNIIAMKSPKVYGYKISPEEVDVSKFVFVDTEVTDIVMNNFIIDVEKDKGEIHDPLEEFGIDLPKYTTYRDRYPPIRVSLFRDINGTQLLYSKIQESFNFVFTNIELFKNDITNIILDIKNIKETFYEFTYRDIELLEEKIDTDEYYVGCRAYDFLEYSIWSEFATTRPANVHKLLWNIAGLNIKPTQKMHFRCRATISSPTVDMTTPVMGFLDFANKAQFNIMAETDVLSAISQQLDLYMNELQEMINGRIDPSQNTLNFTW